MSGAATIENAVFGNLQLSGLWDEVNVVDLNAEAIRVTGAGIQVRNFWGNLLIAAMFYCILYHVLCVGVSYF